MQLKPETNTLPGDTLPPPPLPNTVPDVSPYPVSPLWSDRARVINLVFKLYETDQASAIDLWNTYRDLTKPKS